MQKKKTQWKKKILEHIGGMVKQKIPPAEKNANYVAWSQKQNSMFIFSFNFKA